MGDPVGEPRWWPALPFAIFCILLYTVGVVAGAIWICIQAPHYAHLTRFRVRYYFLLDGYRPEVWWWGVVLLFKGLLINLVLVFFQSPRMICIWLVILFVVFLCLKSYFAPWPKSSMNVADTTYSITLCVLIPLLLARHDESKPIEISMSSIDVVETVVLIFPFLVTAACILVPPFNFVQRVRKTTSTMQFTKQMRLLMMLLTRCSTQSLNQFVLGLDDRDRHTIRTAVHIIMANMLGLQGGKSLFDLRVIPNAEGFSIGTDAELLQRVVSQTATKSDLDGVLEWAKVQFMWESLVHGCNQRYGFCVMPQTEQQQRRLSELRDLQARRSEYGKSSHYAKLQMKCVFDALDYTGDGCITKNEFACSIGKLAPEVSKEEAFEVFDILNPNESQWMARDQFTVAVQGIAYNPQDPAASSARRSILTMALSQHKEPDRNAAEVLACSWGRRIRMRKAARSLQRAWRSKLAAGCSV